MLVFWIAAALIAAAAAAVVLWRAGARTPAPAEDPAASVYRRHLAEQDELRARGLLGEAEWKAARAEAGRRLIAAADQAVPETAAAPRGQRIAVLAAIGAAVLGAVGVYLTRGSPGRPDQPYAARVKAWRAADPASLDAGQAAAVLAEIAAERPTDPQVWSFLGRARAQAGDAIGAARALERAVQLRPQSAADWTALGEVLTGLNGGQPGADAMQAFRRAAALEPDAPEPRYFLGLAEIASGDREAGLALWRQAAAALPPGDQRRQALESEIRRVEAGNPAAEALAAAPAEDQQAAIRGMVEGLAERLQQAPDDPQGWARLVRAYTVLGDEDARGRALARARVLFRDRPADLERIEAAAR